MSETDPSELAIAEASGPEKPNRKMLKFRWNSKSASVGLGGHAEPSRAHFGAN